MHDQINTRPAAPYLSPDEHLTVLEFENGADTFEQATQEGDRT